MKGSTATMSRPKTKAKQAKSKTPLKVAKVVGLPTENRLTLPTADPGFGMVDWFDAHQMGQSRLDRVLFREKSQHFTSFLWPLSLDYYSPIPAVYVTGGYSLQVLNERPLWIARDGLVPLLWFFKSNPTPSGFKRKILIQESFAPYVPNAWRERIGTYRLASLSKSKPEGVNKLLIFGLMSEILTSTDWLKSTLDKVVAEYGADTIKKIPKTAFFVDKNHGFDQDNKHEYLPDYLLAFFSKFGTENIQLLNWKNFDGIPTFEGYHVIELNEGLVGADSFIMHSALKRGATLLEIGPQPERGEEKLLQLSPNHGMYYCTQLGGDYVLADAKEELRSAEAYFNRFEEIMRSEANTNLPWPSWVSSWSKVAGTVTSGND